MADRTGTVKHPELFRKLYVDLAEGGVGLIFSGHCFVHPRGQASVSMMGLDGDANLPFLSELVQEVHKKGARMFLELNHAGSASRLSAVRTLGPSPVANPQNGRIPDGATGAEIQEAIESFAGAAKRVQAAGYDGVHLHAGHGYLFSTFLSPYTNRRSDSWGGVLENRQRLLLEVVRAIRDSVGNFPLTVKLGVRDFVPSGLSIEDGVATAVALQGAGVDAIEVTAGVTSVRMESSQKYSGLSRRRALADRVLHRLFAAPVPGAYFAEDARRVRKAVSCRLIVVGGLRQIEGMEGLVREGVADFVSLGRPFIREPDLVRRVEVGRRGEVACVSCNICAMHEGVHPLKCWRENNMDLLRHTWYRIRGQLTPEGSLGRPSEKDDSSRNRRNAWRRQD
jgi:2,4-dienoyl-CoA reductase-like NADH-dependent reductase (Old Yellow Enzyme family)